MTFAKFDLYFHMANHYRKIKRAKAVVDCSCPKGFNKNCCHKPVRVPSCQASQCPARNFRCYSPEVRKSTNCLQKVNSRPRCNSAPPKSHQKESWEDQPFRSRVPLTNLYRRDEKGSKNDPNKIQKKLTVKVNMKRPPNQNTNNQKRTVADHEYLHFLLNITEDILRNNLYTEEEMEQLFESHIQANKIRLNEGRMRAEIQKLKKELNLPLPRANCVCLRNLKDCNCTSEGESSKAVGTDCPCHSPGCPRSIHNIQRQKELKIEETPTVIEKADTNQKKDDEQEKISRTEKYDQVYGGKVQNIDSEEKCCDDDSCLAEDCDATYGRVDDRSGTQNMEIVLEKTVEQSQIVTTSDNEQNSKIFVIAQKKEIYEASASLEIDESQATNNTRPYIEVPKSFEEKLTPSLVAKESSKTSKIVIPRQYSKTMLENEAEKLSQSSKQDKALRTIPSLRQQSKTSQIARDETPNKDVSYLEKGEQMLAPSPVVHQSSKTSQMTKEASVAFETNTDTNMQQNLIPRQYSKTSQQNEAGNLSQSSGENKTLKKIPSLRQPSKTSQISKDARRLSAEENINVPIFQNPALFQKDTEGSIQVERNSNLNFSHMSQTSREVRVGSISSDKDSQTQDDITNLKQQSKTSQTPNEIDKTSVLFEKRSLRSEGSKTSRKNPSKVSILSARKSLDPVEPDFDTRQTLAQQSGNKTSISAESQTIDIVTMQKSHETLEMSVAEKNSSDTGFEKFSEVSATRQISKTSHLSLRVDNVKQSIDNFAAPIEAIKIVPNNDQQKTVLKIQISDSDDDYIIVDGPVCLPRSLLEKKTIPIFVKESTDEEFHSKVSPGLVETCEMNCSNLSRRQCFKQEQDISNSCCCAQVQHEMIEVAEREALLVPTVEPHFRDNIDEEPRIEFYVEDGEPQIKSDHSLTKITTESPKKAKICRSKNCPRKGRRDTIPSSISRVKSLDQEYLQDTASLANYVPKQTYALTNDVEHPAERDLSDFANKYHYLLMDASTSTSSKFVVEVEQNFSVKSQEHVSLSPKSSSNDFRALIEQEYEIESHRTTEEVSLVSGGSEQEVESSTVKSDEELKKKQPSQANYIPDAIQKVFATEEILAKETITFPERTRRESITLSMMEPVVQQPAVEEVVRTVSPVENTVQMEKRNFETPSVSDQAKSSNSKAHEGLKVRYSVIHEVIDPQHLDIMNKLDQIPDTDKSQDSPSIESLEGEPEKDLNVDAINEKMKAFRKVEDDNANRRFQFTNLDNFEIRKVSLPDNDNPYRSETPPMKQKTKKKS